MSHLHPTHYLRVIVLCVIGLLFCLAIFLQYGCSHTTSGKVLNVGVVASKALDQLSTDRAEARGAREANRLLGSSQWRQVLIGSLGVSGVIASAAVLESKSHKVTAQILRASAVLIWSAAAWHNKGVQR